jgi:uncharacterized RDD family membrane protein YckC
MNTKSKTLYAAFLIAALTPFTLPAFQAQPAPPDAAATPTPAVSAADAGQAPTAAPIPTTVPAPTVAPAPTAVRVPEAALHEVGASAASATVTPTAEPDEKTLHHHHHHNGDEDDRVSVGDATYVGPDENIRGNAVAVLGPVTVDGTVEGNAVAVLGSNTINGTVHGNAVAVMGNLNLGPKARLDGDAVSVGGRVIKDPSAVVGGHVVQQAPRLDFDDNGAASSWWKHGLRMGRPLAIGPHLHLFWIFSIITIALYILLALAFPNGVRKCADTLQQRPGITFLTGILSMIGIPLLFILLCFTLVGIPVAFAVLPLSVMACIAFGKTALYSLVGRSLIGRQRHPALAVIVGVAIVLVLLLVPILGLMVWFLVAFLGFSCALTTLLTSNKPAPAAGIPPAGTPPAAPVQPAAAVAAGAAAAVEPGTAPVPPPAEAPLSGTGSPVVSAPIPVVVAPIPPITESGLPRAGFWVRMVALLIDVLLVGIVIRSPSFFLLVLALYGVVLWKLKGSTIGGIIFSLKVVRHDGRPMDWATAVVRSLACFLSLFFLFLGFIWIAFDPEKQGWHDKIAGTVVVRLPKGASLV